MKVAIIIVTYNSAEEIEGCLAACWPHAATVTVIDNASTDASARWATIANPHNGGFAAAVNQGFRATSEPLVLVLNPDCRLETGLDAMIALFDDPTIGAAGGLLCNADGTAQVGFAVRRFPTWADQALEVAGINRVWASNPLNRRYRGIDLDLRQEQDVEQPAGAFLMVRRTAWGSIGGFDENFYPVWFEDVDFCYRLRAKGWRIRYTPMARATHAGGHAVNKLSWRCKQMYWYGSLLKYAEKHWSGYGERRVALVLLLMSMPRGVIAALSRTSFDPLAVYGQLAAQAWGVLRGRGRNRRSSSSQ